MRLIFTASSGRSGTTYLAEMLNRLPRVVGKCEPQPNFGLVSEVSRGKIERARTWWLETKIPAIERCLKKAGASTYAETSHVILRGFYEALPELGIPFDAIAIARPCREVALSLWRRRSIPGRKRVAIRQRPSPADASILPLRNWEELSDYQLCYWVCLEMAARTNEMLSICKEMGGRIHRTSLREMTTREGFEALLNDMDLPGPDWHIYRRKRNRILNATHPEFRGRCPEADLDDMEYQVRQRIEVE